MPNPIGITFAPTPDQAAMGKKNLAVSGGVPEAIQVLSLHVPKFVGARPLAPEALLKAPTSSRVSSVVESVLRSMGIDTPTGGGSTGITPGATAEPQGLAQMLQQAVGGAGSRYEPTPSVTPGLDPLNAPQLPSSISHPDDILRQVSLPSSFPRDIPRMPSGGSPGGSSDVGGAAQPTRPSGFDYFQNKYTREGM